MCICGRDQVGFNTFCFHLGTQLCQSASGVDFWKIVGCLHERKQIINWIKLDGIISSPIITGMGEEWMGNFLLFCSPVACDFKWAEASHPSFLSPSQKSVINHPCHSCGKLNTEQTNLYETVDVTYCWLKTANWGSLLYKCPTLIANLHFDADPTPRPVCTKWQRKLNARLKLQIYGSCRSRLQFQFLEPTVHQKRRNIRKVLPAFCFDGHPTIGDAQKIIKTTRNSLCMSMVDCTRKTTRTQASKFLWRTVKRALWRWMHCHWGVIPLVPLDHIGTASIWLRAEMVEVYRSSIKLFHLDQWKARTCCSLSWVGSPWELKNLTGRAVWPLAVVWNNAKANTSTDPLGERAPECKRPLPSRNHWNPNSHGETLVCGSRSEMSVAHFWMRATQTCGSPMSGFGLGFVVVRY